MAKRIENLLDRFEELVGDGSDVHPSGEDDDVFVLRGQGLDLDLSRFRLRRCRRFSKWGG